MSNTLSQPNEDRLNAVNQLVSHVDPLCLQQDINRMWDAYIQSEWANGQEARTEVWNSYETLMHFLSLLIVQDDPEQ